MSIPEPRAGEAGLPREMVDTRDVIYEHEPVTEVVRADLAEPAAVKPEERKQPARRRRVVLPIVLFLLTCLSTFLAGVTGWLPHAFLGRGIGLLETNQGLMPVEPSYMPLRRVVISNWENGLIYMACVLAILLTHEMGHFVMTLVYRVRASLPYFVPFPISPIGTMGAVIGMDGQKANRREIFDIGLAGPIAGLLVAVPIMWVGIGRMDALRPTPSPAIDLPLAMRLAVEYKHPGKFKSAPRVPLSQANPYLMAGWVGLLITGLNMMPVSQLDGGHVTYAIFGKWAHWLARGFMVAVFGAMGIAWMYYGIVPGWILMAVLVLLLGTDHPPTSDDTVRLGWFRVALGLASLTIPIFCFVPHLNL